MKNRKEIEMFLLGWSLSAIIFCTTFSFIIGLERRNYENKINNLQKQITIKTK